MITYKVGDATEPQKINDNAIVVIAHIVNNLGGWGAGFVLALSKRWPEPEAAYRGWFENDKRQAHSGPQNSTFELGRVQFVSVGPDTIVVNMLAQDGYVGPNNPVAVDYAALRDCLAQVSAEIVFDIAIGDHDAVELHMPRIGCGLAGGDWNMVEDIVEEVVSDVINVVVYDLP